MATIKEYLDYAELAQAAYGIGYIAGRYTDINGNNILTNANNEVNFTSSQATEFVNHYAVLATSAEMLPGITDTWNGFDAVLFLDKTTGKKILAIAGTLPGPDMEQDAEILLNGTATSQYESLQTFYNALVSSGKLQANEKIDVTGHSLGGYLTQAFTMDYPQVVSHAYTYNALAFGGAIQWLATILGVAPDAIRSGNTTNIYAQEGFEAAAGYGTMLGSVIPVSIDMSYNPVTLHSIKTLTNSLHLYDMLSSIAQTQDLDLLTSIMVHSTDDKILDVVKGAFGTTLIGTAVDQAISLTKNHTGDANGLIDLYPKSASSIATQAKSNPAVLYALAKLNPFAIEGNLPAYANIDPSEYSKSYVKDRAQYLYYSIDPNNRYYKYRTDSHHYEDSTMPDKVLTKGYSVSRILFGGDGNSTLNGLDQEDHLYGMGGEDTLTSNGGADYIEGGKGGDTLKGGAGNDVLVGSSNSIYDDGASDTLEGGDDFDTYFANNSDVIKDSDGKGLVKFEGIDLTGKKYKNKDTGRYEDDDYIYNGDPKSNKGTLTVTAKKGSKSITIQEWSNKDLDIELNDTKDIDVSITKSATAGEGDSGKRSLSFTVTLSRALEDGETLAVAVSSTDERSYTFTSGEKSHTFTHSWDGDTRDEGAIDHTATLTPTASYSGPTKDVKVKILNSGTATVYDDDEDDRHDPLALDMDMDGFISTTALDTSGTYFDITGDGLRERIGWISPEDALLSYDKNDNGQIDGINEIFGSLTESGFEELKRTIDSNYDNKIDRKDEFYNQLQLWHDYNQDAMVQEGELTSLSDEAITSIDLNYVSTRIEIEGNLLTEASKYSTDGGTKELVADIQLATDVADTKVNPSDIPNFTIDESTRTLPGLKGSGLVYDAFILYNTNNEFKALSTVLANNQIQKKVAA